MAIVVWVVASAPTSGSATGTGRPVSRWHGPGVGGAGVGDGDGDEGLDGLGAVGPMATRSEAAALVTDSGAGSEGDGPRAAGKALMRFGTRVGVTGADAVRSSAEATTDVRGAPNATTDIATAIASAAVQRCPGVKLLRNQSRA
ncbi:MAG: hypothetical protein JWO37_128 [Acidimicrobiales bacterium]|jgi:hypothetical protein|nr:hypothetical protein [Acidimicrobiales bacterium]